MTQRFRIDGAEYDAASLPKEGRALVESMTFAQMRRKRHGDPLLPFLT